MAGSQLCCAFDNDDDDDGDQDDDDDDQIIIIISSILIIIVIIIIIIIIIIIQCAAELRTRHRAQEGTVPRSGERIAGESGLKFERARKKERTPVSDYYYS